MCGGEGYINERYIDVDVTTADKCPGCPDCDEDLAAELEAYRLEAEYENFRETCPLWAGEAVVDVPRRPTLPELPADFKFIRIERTA